MSRHSIQAQAAKPIRHQRHDTNTRERESYVVQGSTKGYRQLRVSPLDYPLLGIYWEGSYYIDLAVCFGIRYGAKCMQDTTDRVTTILQHESHQCLNYIDDLCSLHVNTQGAQSGFTRCGEL